MIRRKEMPLWQELPLLLVVAFCLAVLIRTFLVQAFFIPSGSMEKTLLVGDRVLVNKVVYDVRDPLRGEIVVFRGTDNWAPEVDRAGQQRVRGQARPHRRRPGRGQPARREGLHQAGDRPARRQGRVLRRQGPDHGQRRRHRRAVHRRRLQLRLNQPPNPTECTSRRFAEVTVPAGQMFVMGDHRPVSQDARCQGPVPIENVIGRAFVIVWPQQPVHQPRRARTSGRRTPPTIRPRPAAAAAAGAQPTPGDGRPCPAVPANCRVIRAFRTAVRDAAT